MIRRRIIQLRLDISVGCEAIGTSASMNSGWVMPQIQVCMPPIELPSTRRTWRMPRPSVTSRYCAATSRKPDKEETASCGSSLVTWSLPGQPHQNRAGFGGVLGDLRLQFVEAGEFLLRADELDQFDAQ